MKITYKQVQKGEDLSTMAIVEGLTATPEGPEQVFLIRMSDSVAHHAMNAYISWAIAYGLNDDTVSQAKKFLQQQALYAAKYGTHSAPPVAVIFQEVKRDTRKQQQLKPGAPAGQPAGGRTGAPGAAGGIGQGDGDPDAPGAPGAPSAPGAAGAPAGQPAGSGDGAGDPGALVGQQAQSAGAPGPGRGARGNDGQTASRAGRQKPGRKTARRRGGR